MVTVVTIFTFRYSRKGLVYRQKRDLNGSPKMAHGLLLRFVRMKRAQKRGEEPVAAQVLVVARGAEEVDGVLPRLQEVVKPEDEVVILIYREHLESQSEPTIEWIADATRSQGDGKARGDKALFSSDMMRSARVALTSKCKKLSVLATNCSLTATIESYIRSCGRSAVLVVAPDRSDAIQSEI